MKTITRRAIAVVGWLLLVGCGPIGQQPDSAGGKGDTQGDRASRVVVLAIDQATMDWASQTPSSLDGAPIGTPAPDKRFREVFARITDRLMALPHPPAVLALDYHFPAHDGAATRAMAEAFDRAPFPVVLAKEGTDLDPGVHSGSRLDGHIHLFRDLIVEDDEPNPRAWGVPLTGSHVPEPGLQPLAVAVRAAYLQAACGADPATALERAAGEGMALARSFTTAMTRKYLVFGAWEPTDTAMGIPLQPTEITEMSATLVLGQPASSEVAATLGGAVVIIGGYWAAYNDAHDLHQNGQPVPGVLAHGWTAQRLVASGCAL